MSLYPVTLDKERNFKFNMRALSLAEKKMGKAIMGLDIGGLTMEEMATLAWCGLSHEDKLLTVYNVMDIIDEYSNVTEIMDIVGGAIQEAFGIKEDEAEEKNEKN